MSQENVATRALNDPLGPPLLTIYNTSRRWLTLTNYDLVLYDQAVLVVLGLTLGNVGREKRRRREVRQAGDREFGAHIPVGNAERSANIAATPLQTILAADRGNRLVPLGEVVSAVLMRRLGFCKLKLRLTDEAGLQFIWFNSSRMNTDYAEVTKTLADVLGERFRASRTA